MKWHASLDTQAKPPLCIYLLYIWRTQRRLSIRFSLNQKFHKECVRILPFRWSIHAKTKEFCRACLHMRDNVLRFITLIHGRCCFIYQKVDLSAHTHTPIIYVICERIFRVKRKIEMSFSLQPWKNESGLYIYKCY